MSNVVENPETYFRRFVPERSSLAKRLEAEAARDGIPIVGPVVGELLFLLARMHGAGRILEFGAATGYSALFLGEAARASGGRVVTLETDAGRAAEAEKNLREAGLQDTVEVMRTGALQAMEELDGPFDMFFLDIEKKDYAALLPHCARMSRQGALLVADNVAFADADPFNRLLHESPDWRAVHLFAFLPGHSPEKDGLGIALRL